jgi:amidase
MDPFASALDQAAAVRRGLLSAAELVECYLERIERHDRRLNSVWTITADLARAQAAALPRAQAAAPPADGALTGAPVTVKDLAPMAGYPWTLGARVFQRQIGPADHFAVSRIKTAGCPILGRTTTPELGSRPVTEFGLHGTARNPWDESRTPGGSSGGAAAALAAGLCAWSHGSDGGGSVRIPASCCGLVGLKPSRGRISAGPLMGEAWAGLSTQGVITRTVEDAAAALDALAGHLPGDPYWAEPEGSYLVAARRPPPALRAAVQISAPVPVDPEITALVERAGAALEAAGHRVEVGGPETAGLREPFRRIMAAGVASYEIEDPSCLEPINVALIERARGTSAADYVRAVNEIRRRSREVVAFWDDHDVLVTPTLTQPPFEHGHFGGDPDRAFEEAMDWVTFTYPYNCTGQPAVTLPLGVGAHGLPLGVQLVGPPRGEGLLLQAAAELERALPWSGRRPRGFG